MTAPQDGDSTERSAAGPVAGEGGTLRAEGPSSIPPSPASPAGEAAKDADAREVEADLDQLADTQRERDEYLDLAKRTRADFENYRKRMAAEVQGAVARGKAELAQGLIGVIDNLERALQAAGIDPDAGQSPEEALAQGILLTYRELCETLRRAGVESYDPAGEKFDPAWHEALQTRPAEGEEAGTVVEVLQKGFRLDGQVLRAARVVVGE